MFEDTLLWYFILQPFCRLHWFAIDFQCCPKIISFTISLQDRSAEWNDSHTSWHTISLASVASCSMQRHRVPFCRRREDERGHQLQRRPGPLRGGCRPALPQRALTRARGENELPRRQRGVYGCLCDAVCSIAHQQLKLSRH